MCSDLRAADLGLSEQPVDLKEMEVQSAAADPVKSSVPDVTKLEGPTDVPGDTEDARQKRNAVRRAFVYAYEAYKKHAFGHDELKPQSRSHHDWLLLSPLPVSCWLLVSTCFPLPPSLLWVSACGVWNVECGMWCGVAVECRV